MSGVAADIEDIESRAERDLERVIAGQRQGRIHPAEPEPLRRPLPSAPPYPLEALGPILADAARAIRRVIQAPDAVCGASVLAAASLAAQALADVHIDGRVLPLSLWFLTVAESGERKSATDTEAMRATREFEKQLVKQHKIDAEHHEADMAEWTARREAAKKAAARNEGRGLAELFGDIGPAPKAPLIPKVTVADFTAEGITRLLMAGYPSIGAFTDEAALVFGGHGMTNETAARTAATLCKLWDHGSVDRIRASDGAIKLFGRRLALHLMAQPVVAERALSDDLLAGQGFLARCLLAWPASTSGTRHYVAESLRDDPSMLRYADRLGLLHRHPLATAQDDLQELEPRPLKLTAEAAKLWRSIHDAIDARMGPGCEYASCKPWASKTAEQCLRIAGVLTLVVEPNSTCIESETVELAAEIALWHLREAARLSGTASLSREVRDAEALLTWCHETSRHLLHSRDALRFGPSCIRENSKFVEAVRILEKTGWAFRIEGGYVIDGRRHRNVWSIVDRKEDH